ncbi:MAG: energy-coupling factor transporter transmembrane protein EcfT [Candidatus Dormibacteraeota bacterium]|nr:energy-coupling factor transporter transmembrane protein EcfT [Candidatus Dormibacteraeota bacterium]
MALSASNPAYRVLVLVIAIALTLRVAGRASARPVLIAAGAAALLSVAFNLVLSHVGATVLFTLPAAVPVLGGPYTLEALVYGLISGATLAAAILAVAPLALGLEPQDAVDALPGFLARTGGAIAASLGLVPAVARSFVAVSEAQRLRGWRPRGPRSWAEIVVPAVLTTIEDSMQLAESMEARGYGSGPRTHARAQELDRRDWLTVFAATAAVLLFILSRQLGLVPDWYPYPSLAPPRIAALPVAACLVLTVPFLLWRRPA